MAISSPMALAANSKECERVLQMPRYLAVAIALGLGSFAIAADARETPVLPSWKPARRAMPEFGLAISSPAPATEGTS